MRHVTAITVALVASIQPTPAQHKSSTSSTSVESKPASAAAVDVYAMKPNELLGYLHTDVDKSITALRQIDEHLRKLSAGELKRLRKAARSAIEGCPYTHATFVLMQAAADVVKALPKKVAKTVAKDVGDMERRFARVREAFELQWRICEQLGVPSAVAAVNVDSLVKGAPKEVPLAQRLKGSHAGLARAHVLLSTVRKRVDALSPKTREKLFKVQEPLGPATAGMWNFKAFMIRCANDLRIGIYGKGGGTRMPVITARSDPSLLAAYDLLMVLQAHFALYC